MKTVIAEKIRLLYEFCILSMVHHHNDPREARVREMLSACRTEDEAQLTIRGVLLGDETLEQLLARKGY